MTREEAKTILGDYEYILFENEDTYNREAFRMAISALSQEPICDRDCEHCTWTECPIEPCDDVSERNMKMWEGIFKAERRGDKE